MKGYIDGIDFYNLPVQKYYAPPKSWDEKKIKEVRRLKVGTKRKLKKSQPRAFLAENGGEVGNAMELITYSVKMKMVICTCAAAVKVCRVNI